MAAIHELIPFSAFAPVMVLTADVSEESRAGHVRAAAHDFLTKSFNQIEVTLRVSNVLHTKAPYASTRSLESA
jgi:DNA-binding response OmpR family regulator